MSGRGRPGGNPDLEKYQFKSPVDEARTAGIYLRITPTDKERLKKVEDWQEKLRQKLKEIISESERLTTNPTKGGGEQKD